MSFLARRLVTVSRCMIDPAEPQWIEHEGKRHVLHPVDPVTVNAILPGGATDAASPIEDAGWGTT